MPSFKDNAGREWLVTLNVAQAKRLREKLAIDLNDALGGDLCERLADDAELLCNALFVLVEKQALEKQVTDEQFGEGLAGDAIGAATDCLLEAIVSFFPPQRRALLARARSKINEQRTAAIQRAEKLLDSPELQTALAERLDREEAKAIERIRTFGKSSTSSPESAESTPLPLRSAS